MASIAASREADIQAMRMRYVEYSCKAYASLRPGSLDFEILSLMFGAVFGLVVEFITFVSLDICS